VQRHAQTGVAGEERIEHRAQHGAAEVGRGGQVHLAFQLLALCAEQRAGLVEQAQRSLGVVAQKFAFRREPHRAGGALHQPHRHHGLQPLQRRAGSGWRQLQLACGGRQRARIGQPDEELQLRQLKVGGKANYQIVFEADSLTSVIIK